MSKTFTITLRTEDDAAAIRMLRLALKTLMRSYGMKAVSVLEVVSS